MTEGTTRAVVSTSARAIFERLIAAAAAAGLPEGALAFEDAVAGEGSTGTREACARIADASERAPTEAGSPFDATTHAPFLPALARVLRDDAGLRFDFLQNLTAVDWLKRDVLEVVYHLFSYEHRHSFTLKVDLPRAAPRVPSVAGVWPAADWMEREQFDLLGVVFVGHPDLRRLLMPDDWAGHPMRKDYREPASYRGMPTTRPSPLELLKSHDRAHAPARSSKVEP